MQTSPERMFGLPIAVLEKCATSPSSKSTLTLSFGRRDGRSWRQQAWVLNPLAGLGRNLLSVSLILSSTSLIGNEMPPICKPIDPDLVMMTQIRRPVV